MTARPRTTRLIHDSIAVQVGLLIAIWLLGEGIVRALSLPLPGSIFGLGTLLVLLFMRRVSVASIRRGAGLFLSDMLLFLIPAILVIVDHPELLGLIGIKVMIVVIASTATVMAVTAVTVTACARMMAQRMEGRANA